MSWVTSIWSVAAGACMTLGLVHLLVWLRHRSSIASLWYAGVAFSVAVTAGIECSIMRADTPEAFYELHRWGHATFFLTLVCVVFFVRSYFGTGTGWLIWLLLGLRGLILFMAFVPGPTFNFSEVHTMVPYEFLGETLMSPRGTPSRWEALGNMSGVALVAFVVDAAVRLWQKGDRRERQRAVVVTAGVILFIVSCVINGVLMHHTSAQIPYFISLSFLFIVAAMEIELSRDMLNAARLAEELRENAESMQLAAGAGELALWRWDVQRDSIWVSPGGRELYGIHDAEEINLDRFFETLHGDDRESTKGALRQSMSGNGDFRTEYRIVLPGGRIRWIGARGKVEFDSRHEALRMRGVSADITDRKAAELESAQHRAELAHLTRVTTLSELSGSLAHELNQPLAIILSNAQAAQRLLAQTPPDLDEVREILADIVGEDRRAGEVINRLRALLKRGESNLLPLSLNTVIEEVLQLAQGDLIERGVAIRCDFSTDLPQINGDRVQLQQVMLNLVLNAADAMSGNSPGSRRLEITTAGRDGRARVAVRDEGAGLPENPEQVFQPFFTTKQNGLGLGLAICRAIIHAHGGSLWAEPGAGRGAVFQFELPKVTVASP